jgi:hypothetical protein
MTKFERFLECEPLFPSFESGLFVLDFLFNNRMFVLCCIWG